MQLRRTYPAKRDASGSGEHGIALSPPSQSAGQNSAVGRQGMIRPYHAKLALAYKAVDILCIALALRICLQAVDSAALGLYSLVLVCSISTFIGIATFSDLYRSWRIATMGQELANVWATWAGVVAVVSMVTYSLPAKGGGLTSALLYWYAATPVALSVSRVVLRYVLRFFRRHGRNTRTVAIIGGNDLGYALADSIQRATWMGLRLQDVYDERSPGDESRVKERGGFPLKTGLNPLYAMARRGAVDMIFITLPMRAEVRINDLVRRFSNTTASVYIAPTFPVSDLLHSRWYSMGDIPVVSVYESPFYTADGWVKRLEDLLLGCFACLLFAVPMMLIAAAVKVSSPGPVIYRQSRYGMDGRRIMVWKFRTMKVCDRSQDVVQATRDDKRVTRVGRFLRRTSLDELPQLLNVLSGRMSLVGPRPHAVFHNEQYRQLIKGYMLRHKVKPGITGLAQINGWRGETDTLEKMRRRVEYDLAYIRNWSLSLDLKILVQTLWKGFIHERAY